MNFDRLNNAPCVIQPPAAVDPRCDDPEFALANPGLCPVQSILIIRPSISLFCVNDITRFRVFLYQSNTETELTSGVTFESSNPTAFAVGVNSGYGTAISAGIANITATYNGRSVTAKVTVSTGTGDACCNDIVNASAIAVDNSRSMTLTFGGQYATRLSFARAVAVVFGSNLIHVDSIPKDTLKVWSFNVDATEEMSEFSGDQATIAAAIAGITQEQQKTDLLDVFSDISDDLLEVEAHRRIIVLITDGEHSEDTNTQAVIDASKAFRDGGGIVIVVGCRASGAGFDLLQRLATPGFFLNGTADNADDVIASLNYLKSSICAGHCIPVGNEFSNLPELEYSSFLNWQVIEGQVNLVGPGLLDLIPGNGLYVDLASGSKALMRSTDSFALEAGRNYRISFKLAGNQRQAIAGQGVKVYIREVGINDSDPNIFEQTIYPSYTDPFHDYGFVFPALYNATVRIYFQQLGTSSTPAAGNLLDAVMLQDFTTLETLFKDNFDDENLTFVEPACGPSSAIDPIENPDAPTADSFVFPGSDVWNGESYRYAVSFLTPEGETALSDTVDVATSVTADTATRITFQTPPSNVIAVRIWRSIEDGGTDLFLLVSLRPEEYTSFEDTETHAQFSERFDLSIVPPTSNTTGKEEGALGIGYSYCCYYWDEAVEDDELVSAVPPMTSNTEPSGTVTTNTEQDADVAWVAFDGNDTSAFVGWKQVNPGTNEYTVPVYLAYEFPLAKTIRRYTISLGPYYPSNGLNLNAWLFEGSNDGSSWTTLDSQSGITNPMWEASNSRTYNIASPGSYKFYRLSITHTNLVNDGPIGDYYQWVYVTELKMYESETNIVTRFENNCPECAVEPPGEQIQDPTPLPDIESGFTPPTIYTSTKSRCASCESGLLNLPAEPLEWSSVNHSSIGGVVIDIVQLTAGSAKLKAFRLDLTGKLFNNPASLVLSGGDSALGPFTDIIEYNNQYLPDVFNLIIPDSTPEYEFYTLTFTRFQSDQASPILSDDSFYGVPTSNQVCASATETSTISQADADSKANASALAAAEALLNCIPVYTATESFTARCPLGSFGNSVTKSATRQSAISQADAVRLATEAAQEEAEAEIDCTLSNNAQNIVINDAAETLSKATPYPSVKHVTGLTGVITKVTVTLTGLTHASPDDIGILLRSPEGTLVWLMRNAGGVPSDPGDSAISNVNLVFDDAAGSFIPDTDSPPISSGTWKPKGYGSEYNMPELPSAPYGTLLSAFNGEDPNGSWSLWVVDDLTVFSGNISGGWDLTLTVA